MENPVLTVNQSLDTAQKSIARNNIGAAASSDIITDYDDLTDKPQINGNTLAGNKTASDLGLGTYSKPSGGIPATDLAYAVQTSLDKADTALQSAPVSSVDGKTGAVTILPSGGSSGQVLKKNSATDYDVYWANESGGGGGGGTTDYTDLSNKPSINSVTLSGNKTTSDLGIHEIPSGGSSGQFLRKTAGTDYSVGWGGQDGNPLYYAICSTASDSAIKYITISDLTSLTDGVCIRVLFTNAHSLSISPTLTVTGSGGSGLGSDITIYSRFGTAIGGNTWDAGTVIDFVYKTSSTIPPLPGFVIVSDPAKASLASPAFTGTPTAPTASSGTNTTQIATTAFVQTALTGKAASDLGVSGASANQFVKISSVDGSGKPTAFGSGTVAEIDLGISGAIADDMIKVSTVDGNGKPTAWAKAVSGTDYQTPYSTTTLTIATSDWSNNSASKTVNGMTATALVFLEFSDTTTVYTVAQSTDTLTFTVSAAPSSAVTVNVGWFV